MILTKEVDFNIDDVIELIDNASTKHNKNDLIKIIQKSSQRLNRSGDKYLQFPNDSIMNQDCIQVFNKIIQKNITPSDIEKALFL